MQTRDLREDNVDAIARLNIAYTLNMLTVPEDVIREIETEVIGYEKYQLSL